MSGAVRIIVEIVTSEADRSGNRYSFARFYAPHWGREPFLSMDMGVGDGSNARHLAFKACGNDWNAILTFESTIPKARWKAVAPSYVDDLTAMVMIKRMSENPNDTQETPAMSNKPIPASLTAVLLTEACFRTPENPRPLKIEAHTVARLASEIHRLVRGKPDPTSDKLIDKRVSILNDRLAPFGYKLNRGKILILIHTETGTPYEIT